MLVSVSSVSSRPSASVRSPLLAASSGTPKPAVQIVRALGRTAPSANDHRVGPHLGHHVAVEHGDSVFGQPLGDGSTTRLAQRRHQGSATHQNDRASLFGQLGGGLGASQPGADNGDRSFGVQLVQLGAQPLRILELRYGISEFGGAGHRSTEPRRCCRPRRLRSHSPARRPTQAPLCEQRCRYGWRCRRLAGHPRRAACRSRPSRRSCLPRVGAAGSARRTSAAG